MTRFSLSTERAARALQLPAACSAVAAPTVPKRIRFIVGVPAFAVSFASVPFSVDDRGEAASDVDRAGDGLQVCGIHALPNAAQMVDLFAFRDRADQQFVRVPVGGDHFVVKSELSVASMKRERRRPEPAGIGLINLLPEAFFGGAEGSDKLSRFGVLRGFSHAFTLTVPRAQC